MGDKQDETRYFVLLGQILEAEKRHDRKKAVDLSYESLPLVSAVIRQWLLEYGRFDICTIPAIRHVAGYLVAHGDAGKLSELRDWVMALDPYLAPSLPVVDTAIDRASIRPSLVQLVTEEPGVVQRTIPKRLGVDGTTLRWLLDEMQAFDMIERVKEGSSYRLFLR